MNLRAIVRLAGLIALFVVVAPLHLLTKSVVGQSRWPSRFLAAAAWIIGARVRRTGGPIGPHTLLLSNHVSWLDILMLAGATGCRFVSKDALGHPFLHWLADQNSTIYVRRSDRSGVREQADTIARALESEQPLALFPEGTTGPGTHLLPFRSTLLEAAKFASRDVVIRPVALDYGAAAAAICWWEETGKDNALRVLGRRGTLPVALNILEPLDRNGDRKGLAAAARQEIAHRLRLTLPGQSPIGDDQ